MVFAQTPRTTSTRFSERMSDDEALVHGVLDEAYVCHLGFVVDGEPRVLPTLHVRVGDTLYLHGSTGSRPLREARPEGLTVCVAVTLIDGLVLARSQFHHSANYRSVVAHGRARLVTDPAERDRAFTALVDKVGVLPGRAAGTRPPTAKESAQTAVLALPLTEVSAKVRGHGVVDEDDDLDLPHWAGIVPLRLVRGQPQPAPGVRVPVPEYLQAPRSPWLTPAPMSGARVVLEPLDLSHADELFAALDHAEVWEHLSTPRTASPDDMTRLIARLLADPARTAWVQRVPDSGALIGMTSFLKIDESLQTLEMGSTCLAPAWWRTGVNTEAKLLLLTRAFEELGAVRVQWQTDERNTRSQRAIERLGATREGVLRANKRRGGGALRNSVLYAMTADDWPAARAKLTGRLLMAGR
jgi:RimJ/RimL family protein N-acetyltransferase/nitroimidazol reductase NimA-like FMN-containing flavoprotein (pyridoxamine 5'-phosphate oxidase superfamily)